MARNMDILRVMQTNSKVDTALNVIAALCVFGLLIVLPVACVIEYLAR